MTDVYRYINTVPRLYGIKWFRFLILVGILFVSMFLLIKLCGAPGIVLSFLVGGLAYLGFLAAEHLDPFLVRGLLNLILKRELTSMAQGRQSLTWQEG
jgi:hypothetical protein